METRPALYKQVQFRRRNKRWHKWAGHVFMPNELDAPPCQSRPFGRID